MLETHEVSYEINRATEMEVNVYSLQENSNKSF